MAFYSLTVEANMKLLFFRICNGKYFVFLTALVNKEFLMIVFLLSEQPFFDNSHQTLTRLLYIFTMLHTRFRVNPHGIVA